MALTKPEQHKGLARGLSNALRGMSIRKKWLRLPTTGETEPVTTVTGIRNQDMIWQSSVNSHKDQQMMRLTLR